MRVFNRLGLVLSGAWLALPSVSWADDTAKNLCSSLVGLSGSNNCKSDTGKPLFGRGSYVITILDTLIFLVAAVSVIMLVIAGFRMVTSGGSSDAVKGARNSILYSILGIVIAISAYAIVHFVTQAVK
jgi:hypothetical protein